jgi:hypothetical protein
MEKLMVRKYILNLLLFLPLVGLPQRVQENANVTTVSDLSKIKVIAGNVYTSPYNNVNWNTTLKIASSSHIHIHNQASVDSFYNLGIRHFPSSNYYPSAPWYPIDSIHKKEWHPSQDFGVVLNGVYQSPPIDWNVIVNDWSAGLPIGTQALLPFGQGALRITNKPLDALFSPNAEHHGFSNFGGHLNSLGSFWSSGHFDAADQFELTTNGYSSGTGRTWQSSIDSMLINLQFAYGGGVIINHTTNGGVSTATINTMLDHDSRVLGIEVFNAFFERNTSNGWSETQWDEILTSGRKCLGFFTYDHYDASLIGVGITANILLLDNFTEKKSLISYRNGSNYGAVEADNFEFTDLSDIANVITATTNKSANFTFISNGIVVKTETGVTTSNYNYRKVLGDGNFYVRVKVEDPAGGFLFSQPFYIQ